jgi:hypothetical protein
MIVAGMITLNGVISRNRETSLYRETQVKSIIMIVAGMITLNGVISRKEFMWVCVLIKSTPSYLLSYLFTRLTW